MVKVLRAGVILLLAPTVLATDNNQQTVPKLYPILLLTSLGARRFKSSGRAPFAPFSSEKVV